MLSYADAMTITGQDTTDEMFAALRVGFSEEENIELTAHVAFENFRSRFNRALRIEAQGFCRLSRLERGDRTRTVGRPPPRRGAWPQLSGWDCALLSAVIYRCLRSSIDPAFPRPTPQFRVPGAQVWSPVPHVLFDQCVA